MYFYYYIIFIIRRATEKLNYGSDSYIPHLSILTRITVYIQVTKAQYSFFFVNIRRAGTNLFIRAELIQRLDDDLTSYGKHFSGLQNVGDSIPVGITNFPSLSIRYGDSTWLLLRKNKKSGLHATAYIRRSTAPELQQHVYSSAAAAQL